MMIDPDKLFQSPRSGKFVSDVALIKTTIQRLKIGFNPLDRGNLYQIVLPALFRRRNQWLVFQSPRSGKFVSDAMKKQCLI